MPEIDSLLPCPFCGSTHVRAWTIQGAGEAGSQQAVGCEECGVHVRCMGITVRARDKAVKIWNRRTPES